MRAARVTLLLAATLCLCALSVAEFTAKDMHELNRLGGFIPTPQNGAVYSVSKWDAKSGKTTSNLNVWSPTGGEKKLTEPGVGRDGSPTMMKNDLNTVFYMGAPDGGEQGVFMASLDGSAPLTRLTSYPVPIGNLIVTPNYIVFTAEVWDECDADLECSAAHDERRDKAEGIVFNQLFVRHWDTIMLPGKSSQLFTHQIQKNGTYYSLVGAPSRVTAALPKMNVPVPPFGGLDHITVHHEYSRIAFTAALIDRAASWSTGWVIYEALVNPATGHVVSTPPPKCLTCGKYNGARTTNPAYFGPYLAFLAMDRAGYEADRFHLEILEYADSSVEPRPFQANWDRSISEFVWDKNGAIFAAADDDGHHRIYNLGRPQSPTAPQLVNINGTNTGMAVTKDNRLMFVHHQYDQAADVHYLDLDAQSRPGPVHQMTKLNPTFPRESFDAGTSFYFTSPHGDQVQSWLLKPAGWKEGVKYPMILLIHGGPQGAWTNRWSYGWNPHLYTQRGYAVLMINPHGSTGYGQEFTDAVNHNWGGLPFRDLMTGLTEIKKAYPWLDQTRFGAAGGSYGGFMINWIAGNAPDTFTALVNHDGLFDIPSFHGSTEELWFPEWEFGGLPWENPEGYSKWNPADHVAKWKTPMYIIHGEKDYRVDISQGLAAFSALQRKGIPSKLLYYPEENHWVLKPENNIQWYAEVLDWFDTHTKNKY